MNAGEIVERFERSWAERDPAAMVACFAPGATYNAPGVDHASGAGIAEFAEAFFTAFPDSRYEWTTVARDGEVAAVEWTFSGTMTGPLLGIEPTGGTGSARGVHTIRLAGERLASVEAFWDNQGFFAQLGIKA